MAAKAHASTNVVIDEYLVLGKFGSGNRFEPEPDRTEPRFGVQVQQFVVSEPNPRFGAAKMPNPEFFFNVLGHFRQFYNPFSRFGRFEPRTEPEPNLKSGSGFGILPEPNLGSGSGFGKKGL